MKHYEDGYGSRLADEIINGSYYSGVEDEESDLSSKKLTKAEENEIIMRLAQLMKGSGRRKKSEKVRT